MARAVKTAASAKSPPSARKAAPRPAPPTKAKATPFEKPVMKLPRGAAKSSRSATALTRVSTPAPTEAPKLSKDELRAQVTKLESSNAALRAKSREANRAIKAANGRVAELETEVAELQEQAAAQRAKAKPTKVPKEPRRAPAARKAAIEPDDAGPHDVAAAASPPLAEEAQAAEDAPE